MKKMWPVSLPAHEGLGAFPCALLPRVARPGKVSCSPRLEEQAAMIPDKKTSELAAALLALKPAYWRAFGFAIVSGLLVLVPTLYMLEVYDRVVNSRNHMTLAMLTLLVLLAYVVMEVLDWARAETLREAGAALDRALAPRVFQAIYESNLRRPGAASIQPMHDFRTLRDFLHHPLLGSLMESPVSLVFALILFLMSPALGWSAVAGALVQVALGLVQRTQHPAAAAGSQPGRDCRPAICRQLIAPGRGDRGHGHAAAHPPPLDGPAARVPWACKPRLPTRRRLSRPPASSSRPPWPRCCWASGPG